MFFFILLVIAVIGITGLLSREMPFLRIALGVFLITPLIASLYDLYYIHPTTDKSVGAILLPIIILILIGVAVFGVYLLALGLKPLKKKQRFTVIIFIACIYAVIPFLSVVIYSYLNINRVIKSAESLAQDTPYCIQVGDDSGIDYREAVSSYDFFGATMRAKVEQGMYLQHHAILAIGEGNIPNVYYWSYNEHSFIPATRNDIPIYCNSRIHFATDFSSKNSTTHTFRFLGMRFTIPKEYRAKILNYGGMNALVFSAKLPDFEPSIETFSDIVSVEFNAGDRIKMRLIQNDNNYSIEEQADKYGLTLHIVHNKEYKTDYLTQQYYAKSSNATINTLIECTGSSCLHTFSRNGRLYTFNHPLQDISKWKTMQETLEKCTNSFILQK